MYRVDEKNRYVIREYKFILSSINYKRKVNREREREENENEDEDEGGKKKKKKILLCRLMEQDSGKFV